MPARAKLNPPAEGASDEASPPAGLYFLDPTVEFFSSGCTLLNCVLGGGWAKRRVINIVGDKSSGKTLQAIEGITNFIRENPEADAYYCECESAFDKGYAAAMGLPIERVKFPNDEQKIFTVEDFFNDIEGVIAKKRPALYVLDSLDALSDAAEMARERGESSYGANKAKQMSQEFRKLNQHMANADLTLMIISQVRENIGVTFGKSTTRAGGKALDFYASQVIELAHVGRLKKTVGGVERVYGIRTKARCEKNKISMPFRQCEFPIYFGYGVEDVVANIEFLLECGRHGDLFTSKEHAEKTIKTLHKLSDDGYHELAKTVADETRRVWRSIEEGFLSKRKKY